MTTHKRAFLPLGKPGPAEAEGQLCPLADRVAARNEVREAGASAASMGLSGGTTPHYVDAA